MPKLIDDTQMLDRMADEIVSGRAEHPTGAMRRLGVADGSAVERRLLRKWAAGSELLLSKARERCAFARGRIAGFNDAMRSTTVSVRNVAVREPRPSWWSRLFMWTR